MVTRSNLSYKLFIFLLLFVDQSLHYLLHRYGICDTMYIQLSNVSNMYLYLRQRIIQLTN